MRLDLQKNSEAFLRMWSRTHLVMIVGRMLPVLDYAAWRFLLLFSWMKLGLTVELGVFSQTKFWTRWQWWASRGDIWDIFVKESWETGTGWSWSFFQKPRSCTHSLPLAGVWAVSANMSCVENVWWHAGVIWSFSWKLSTATWIMKSEDACVFCKLVSLEMGISCTYWVCPWQILHLAPSQRPGEFSAWVLSDGNMYKVPVQVPRVFYLNTRAPNTEEYPGARVNRVLPHGRQSFNLIEVCCTVWL